MKAINIFYFLLVMLFSQCMHKEKVLVAPTPNCLPDTVRYTAHIAPIMIRSCNACHGPFNTTGYNTFSFAELSALAQTGKLVGSVNHMPDYIAMPIRSNLDTCSIMLITKWVAQGGVE